MMTIFQIKSIGGDRMQIFNEKLDFANNDKMHSADNPSFPYIRDKGFELFIEKYVRENLYDIVEDVLCGAI